jgi:transposase-like protein
MAEETIRCPHCHSKGVVKSGRARNGKARYRCQRADEHIRILDAPRK